jgi:selenoprotein W-related protein
MASEYQPMEIHPMCSAVSIIYCRPCGYEERATEAANAVRSQCKLDVDLVPGIGGIFEVKVGDRTVAKRERHFPSSEEIVAAVAATIGRSAAKS